MPSNALSDADRLIHLQIVTETQQAKLLEGLATWFRLDLTSVTQTCVELGIEGSQPPDSGIQLALTAVSAPEQWLAGLQAWEQLGLLRQVPVQVRLAVRSSHPALLQGLDVWLELGLLSNADVQLFCETNLTCAIAQTAPANDFLPIDAVPDLVTRSPQPESVLVGGSTGTSIDRPQRWLAQRLGALMAELSVLWLLLLGVVLVVLSSSVLAASQWQRFPAAGQYGLLLFYTWIFGFGGIWASRRSNLRLTAQALQAATLLLVPINFLAIDRFELWRTPLDWLIVAIAGFSLTIATLVLFRRLPAVRWQPWHYLALSYLNLGWGVPRWATIAIYAGVGLTVAMQVFLARRSIATAQPFLSLSRMLWGYAIAVLLVRAIFIDRLDPTQLALAIGICGALLAWLAQRMPVEKKQDTEPDAAEPAGFLRSSQTWEWIGGSLLILAWLTALSQAPGQAIVLSGLGIWFFGSRLRRFEQVADLGVLFFIGVHLHWLVWDLLPLRLQASLVNGATGLLGIDEGRSWTLLSLVLLPYLLIWVLFTEQLQRRRSPLARFSSSLALGLGTVLTTLSLANPLVRTINLAASTRLLGMAARSQVLRLRDRLHPVQDQSTVQDGQIEETGPAPRDRQHLWLDAVQPLLYLLHTSGLLTVASVLDCVRPNLELAVWAVVLILLAIAEWGVSFGDRSSGLTGPPSWIGVWRQSAWHLGLAIAVVGYGLFLVNSVAIELQMGLALDRPVSGATWGIAWLAVPIALTGLGSRARGAQSTRQPTALWLSTIALGLGQLLTFFTPTTVQLWALAIATGLMLINNFYLRRPRAAAIGLGFGLAWIGTFSVAGVWGIPPLSEAGWWVAIALVVAGLWLLRSVLASRLSRFSRTYAIAADFWAIVLSVLELLALTVHAGNADQDWRLLSIRSALVAIGVLIGAIAWRYWQQPQNWAIYLGGWSWEILVIEWVSWLAPTQAALVVANVALGLGTQLVGEWLRRSGDRRLLTGWQVLPLVYAGLAVVLRLGTIERWTGWTTLGVALILLGVGRGAVSLRPVLYLGLAGLSIGVYELGAARLLEAAVGDGLIVLAGLSLGLIVLYRLGHGLLTRFLAISPVVIRQIAHLHWGVGSALLLASIGFPATLNPAIALATGMALTGYALWQGRGDQDADGWVYAGIAEAGAIAAYLFVDFLPDDVADAGLPWVGAIVAAIASGLYIAPWMAWGWSPRPWQRAAVVLPLVAIGVTAGFVHPGSLLIAAACYVLLAQLKSQIRLTYLSIFLVNWAIARWIQDSALDRPMLYATLIGLSLLYVAQIDPRLQQSDQRQTRHLMNCLGAGIICLFALLFHHETGILPSIVSLAVMFAGLGFRVRAFLYIGTVTFLLNAFYQLIVLAFAYSLLKWIIGLLVGLAFIWIAATFETRREQINLLLRRWFAELQDWQ